MTLLKLINLEERFGRSLFIGTIASTLMVMLNLFAYYVLHWTNRRLINWVAMLVFGREAKGAIEDIFCALVQIGFATTLLIVADYLYPTITGDNRIWKGLHIGIGSWFLIMVFSHVTGIEKTLPIVLKSAITLVATSSIWGISYVLMMSWLERRLD